MALMIARPATPPPMPPASAPTLALLLDPGVELGLADALVEVLAFTAAALLVLPTAPVVVEVVAVVVDELLLLLEEVDDGAGIGLKVTPVYTSWSSKSVACPEYVVATCPAQSDEPHPYWKYPPG